MLFTHGLIKLSYIVSILLVVVLVCVSPTFVEAQPTDSYQWKTYLNPKLGLQIDYPLMKFMNIIEHETLPSIAIIGDFAFYIFIDKVNSTNGQIQQFANSTINTEISQFNNQILHDIHPVKYANLSGYAATLYNNSPNNNNTSINKFIFLLKDDNIYQFVLNDSNQDYHGKTFDRMVNSTKFFD